MYRAQVGTERGVQRSVVSTLDAVFTSVWNCSRRKQGWGVGAGVIQNEGGGDFK